MSFAFAPTGVWVGWGIGVGWCSQGCTGKWEKLALGRAAWGGRGGGACSPPASSVLPACSCDRGPVGSGAAAALRVSLAGSSLPLPVLRGLGLACLPRHSSDLK